MHPKYEHKEKDDKLRTLLKSLLDATPFYLPSYVIESFPKFLNDFFTQEQRRPELILKDSSNQNNKATLKTRVDEDLKRFKGFIFLSHL